MIEMIDLQRQRAGLEPGLSAALHRVIAHGRYINGPEVADLERALAALVGVGHVIGCANGTDALQLMLRAEGIGAGDCVCVPSLTFAATAEAVALVGAVPLFVDVDPGTGTLCPDSVRRALATALTDTGLRPRAVIAVDLFSVPADYAVLGPLCAAQGVSLLCDAAHSIGTVTPAGACGALGRAAATSFYPSKALGCYGDGGAVFTDDADLAARLRMIANHGIAPGTADHACLGTNSRLDTLQAAILLEKLTVFGAELTARRAVAARYSAALASLCAVPLLPPGTASAWTYYAIRHPDRDALRQHLLDRGIRSVVYYRTPTHEQAAFAACPVAPGGLDGTARFADTLLCLPIHPYMEDDEVDQVIDGVRSFFAPPRVTPAAPVPQGAQFLR